MFVGQVNIGTNMDFLSGVHTINTPAMKPANTLAMIARELLVAFTRHKQAHVKHQIGHGSDCNEEI